MPTNEAYFSQIETYLETTYFPLINQLPVQRWSEDQHHKNRISRSLAAFAIENLAEMSPAQAASHVIDCGDDNGIDSIAFYQAGNKLFIIQAKYNSAPNLADCNRFCDGIRRIAEGDFAPFGQSLTFVLPEIESALDIDGLKIFGGVVYRSGDLGEHAINSMANLQAELNQHSDRFEWMDLNINALYQWLAVRNSVRSVTTRITLEKWAGVDTPRRAFYGLVSAKELAEIYRTHGKALFEKNIRFYLGDESVNKAIYSTAKDNPSDLFYLNNGLTAVCSSIRISARHTRESARFVIEGFSIVNGAQTVGSISSINTPEGISPEAKLLTTIIEVGAQPDNIGPKITRTRNTQNEVRGLHFAALHSKQESLRQEIAVSNIVYEYRPSAESRQRSATVITIDQAITALSALSGDINLAVMLKKDRTPIYDVNGVSYQRIFHENLTGVKLCRAVRLFNYIHSILQGSESSESAYSSRKMFFRHSVYFICSIYARRNQSFINKPVIDLDNAERTSVSRDIIELSEVIYDVSGSYFRQKGYLSIFRNLTDSEPLARDVMTELTRRDQAARAAAAATLPTP